MRTILKIALLTLAIAGAWSLCLGQSTPPAMGAGTGRTYIAETGQITRAKTQAHKARTRKAGRTLVSLERAPKDFVVKHFH